jgi:hypothetical protein
MFCPYGLRHPPEKENPAEAGLGDRRREGRVKLHSTCEVSAKAQIPYLGDFLPASGKTEKRLFSVGQQTT